MRRSLLLVVPITMIVAASACSLLTDLSDLGGDAGGNDGAVLDVHEDLQVITSDGGVCECVDLPSGGFRGPVATWTGAGTAPTCDPNYSAPTFDGYYGPDAATATCSCSCGAPTGVTCPSTFSANLFDQSNCANSKCDTVTLNGNQCVTVQMNCVNVDGFVPTTLTPTGGTCALDASTNIPPVTWEATVRECETAIAPAQGECQAGQVCTPIPASPYETRPCILGAGDIPCPQFYSDKRVFYTGASDNRQCSTCSCGSVTGTCSATLSLECGGLGTKVVTSGTCSSLGDPGEVSVQGQPTFTDGGCAPSGGQLSGTVSVNEATTVCCAP